MSYRELKEQVLKANLAIVEAGLVKLTWGNVSGADRKAGVMAIKPSGVPYDTLTPDDIVVLSIQSGEVIEGKRRPSSDTPTHLLLMREFPSINGIVHTHSLYGTSFAQANRDIPCFGTTHADNFYTAIPCTRPMKPAEVQADYELNTGHVIIETFRERKIEPANVPGVLVASHAPFAWAGTVEKAVENAIVLEFAAQLAMNTLAINPEIKDMQQALRDKHFFRKHGPGATYGQVK